MNNEETVWVELTRKDAVWWQARYPWRDSLFPERRNFVVAVNRALEGPRMIALPAEAVEQYAAWHRAEVLPEQAALTSESSHQQAC